MDGPGHDDRTTAVPVSADSSFDALARLAASLLDAPTAFVVLSEKTPYALLGAHGLAADGSIERALCARVGVQQGVVIETDPGLRVGTPVRADGAVCGVLVVVAPWFKSPRTEQLELLGLLADQAGELVAKQRFATECASALESAKRLAVIFEGIAEGIVLHDRDAKIIATNPAAERILGHAFAEMASGEVQWSLIHEDGSPMTQSSMPAWVTLASGNPLSDVVMGMQGPNGEVRWLSVNSRPMRGERDAKPYAVVVTFHDITALRAGQVAAERLARQEHLVTTGTLAAGVGHEINNPLAAILANLELAIDEIRTISGGSPAGRLRELLTLLSESRDGVDRIRIIVRGLRSLAREADAPKPTDVEAALQIALNMAAHETRHRASVVTDLTGVPPVLADESRLTQVLVNLVVNAAQSFATRDLERNRIHLRTRFDGETVTVEVEDNGAGIPPELERRIFDPFFTTKPPGHGTGLGLSISRNIVTDLGGELTLAPREGGGSIFRVALPIADRRVDTIPPRSAAPPAARARILLVDDEPAVLAALRRSLEREHDVVACGDPREAAKHIANGETFDVVFCDVMMPSMNGNDLYELARAHAPGLAERFVFITGGATQPRLREFLDAVDNERIDKPFSIQNIRSIARRYASMRPR